MWWIPIFRLSKQCTNRFETHGCQLAKRTFSRTSRHCYEDGYWVDVWTKWNPWVPRERFHGQVDICMKMVTKLTFVQSETHGCQLAERTFSRTSRHCYEDGYRVDVWTKWNPWCQFAVLGDVVIVAEVDDVLPLRWVPIHQVNDRLQFAESTFYVIWVSYVIGLVKIPDFVSTFLLLNTFLSFLQIHYLWYWLLIPNCSPHAFE